MRLETVAALAERSKLVGANGRGRYYLGRHSLPARMDHVPAMRAKSEVRMMRYTMFALTVACLTGCTAVQGPDPTDKSDIRNWDFSACLSDVDTCTDLLLDNQEVILGGHTLVGFIIAGFGVPAQAIDLGFLPPPPLSDAPDQADVRSWDFSACFDDIESFGTCSDLLLDNAGIILGGLPFVESVVDGWEI